MINKPIDLNPECFTYELYESNWWSLLDLTFTQSMDRAFIKRAIDKYAVGYCDASRVTVRPRNDSFAVMFEKDDERFWFHLEKWWFEGIH